MINMNVTALRVGAALVVTGILAFALTQFEVGAVSSLWLPEAAVGVVTPCSDLSLDACSATWAGKVAHFVELRAKRRHSAAHRFDRGGIKDFVRLAFDPYGACSQRSRRAVAAASVPLVAHCQSRCRVCCRRSGVEL
jgi:hypothetical protein